MENMTSPESNQQAVDFTKIPSHELRPLAQQLIERGDVKSLKQLLMYADEQKNALPHNTMYSSEWDYWNLTYLKGEIKTALQALGSLQESPENPQ